MNLYHFTSRRFLRGIAEHGLTVGDVPTDIRRGKGRVGVWLTTAPDATGHGLENSAVWKGALRLSVDIPEDAPALVRWMDWAPKNVTPETMKGLHGAGDRMRPETWYVYFGRVKPESIVEVVDMLGGNPVTEWPKIAPSDDDLPGVPYWRRGAWHRRLLRDVARALQSRNSN